MYMFLLLQVTSSVHPNWKFYQTDYAQKRLVLSKFPQTDYAQKRLVLSVRWARRERERERERDGQTDKQTDRERERERERERDVSDVTIVALKLEMSSHFPCSKFERIVCCNSQMVIVWALKRWGFHTFRPKNSHSSFCLSLKRPDMWSKNRKQNLKWSGVRLQSHFSHWKGNQITVIAEIFVRVKISYSSVRELSYAVDFRTARTVSHTLLYVHGFLRY